MNDEFMNAEWQGLAHRAQVRDANGDLCLLVTGRESAAELRSLCLLLVGSCPCVNSHPECPFRLLSRLSKAALISWLEALDEPDLRALFATELQFRARAQMGAEPKIPIAKSPVIRP